MNLHLDLVLFVNQPFVVVFEGLLAVLPNQHKGQNGTRDYHQEGHTQKDLKSEGVFLEHNFP